ncbi:MAG: flagellar brake domain-containing protein [Lachnospiraceae bacterium]|nr:flagellar brake domain-containing protein [Lachnospiraceae bacterium]
MLSDYILPGNKVEIQAVERVKPANASEGRKTYSSQVRDIMSDDQVEILMPFEKTKIVLLPVDAEFELYFYTQQGLFQCFAKVLDRYKDGNQFVLLMELTSNLRRFQRREYYRLSCALEMNSRLLEKEEEDAFNKNDEVVLVPGLPLKRSVVVDISGGGLRFISNYKYEENSHICCKYNLIIDGVSKEYTLISKVLMVKELENRPGVFEHRAQYVDIDTYEREEIIRFIFEEERKHRKREKGL